MKTMQIATRSFVHIIRIQGTERIPQLLTKIRLEEHILCSSHRTRFDDVQAKFSGLVASPYGQPKCLFRLHIFLQAYDILVSSVCLEATPLTLQTGFLFVKYDLHQEFPDHLVTHFVICLKKNKVAYHDPLHRKVFEVYNYENTTHYAS